MNFCYKVISFELKNIKSANPVHLTKMISFKSIPKSDKYGCCEGHPCITDNEILT